MPSNGSLNSKVAMSRTAAYCLSFVEIPASRGWGLFLRRLSLDELPQLFNVLRGEMSLVGPRPLQIRDSERLLALDPLGYKRRLEVLPGVTGPWQVGGRSELNHESMVQLDVDYVENWSLARDVVIICKTFFVVLFRVGAY